MFLYIGLAICVEASDYTKIFIRMYSYKQKKVSVYMSVYVSFIATLPGLDESGQTWYIPDHDSPVGILAETLFP